MVFYAVVAFCYAVIGGMLSYLAEDDNGPMVIFSYGFAWPFLVAVTAGRYVAHHGVRLFRSWR